MSLIYYDTDQNVTFSASSTTVSDTPYSVGINSTLNGPNGNTQDYDWPMGALVAYVELSLDPVYAGYGSYQVQSDHYLVLGGSIDWFGLTSTIQPHYYQQDSFNDTYYSEYAPWWLPASNTPLFLGNTIASADATAPRPVITGIDPVSAVAGSSPTLCISGSFLGGTAATIGFSGSGISINNINDDSGTTCIDVSIDYFATPGDQQVTVTTEGGTSDPVTFTVLPPPYIISIDPPSGMPGDETTLTITGSGFGTDPQVNISGMGIIVNDSVALDDGTIIADITIAPDATTGDYDVTVEVDGVDSNWQTFSVIEIPPCSISDGIGIATGLSSQPNIFLGGNATPGATTCAPNNGNPTVVLSAGFPPHYTDTQGNGAFFVVQWQALNLNSQGAVIPRTNPMTGLYNPTPAGPITLMEDQGQGYTPKYSGSDVGVTTDNIAYGHPPFLQRWSVGGCPVRVVVGGTEAHPILSWVVRVVVTRYGPVYSSWQ